ncbi:MAG: FecR family protein [Acidobacteria bacterium]|nr:FecR family protein [Acidobacteriota bacterium]
MRVLIAIGVLGLWIHGASTALPGTPDASAPLTNARPGHVRHVSGNPAVLGAGLPQSEPLQAGRQLKRRDQVHTRTGDRVEIVLSANGYLRLGGKARVEVFSDDYPAMDVRLLEGEAVVDSEGADGKHHAFSVSTPAGGLRVVRPGFYRIRVHRERPVGVTVFSGRLSWLGSNGRQSELSQRRHYVLDPLAATPSARRMDKYEWATLDPWGKERSGFLLNCFWGRRPLVSVPAVTQPVRANAGYQIKAGGGLRTTGNSRAELLLTPGTYLRVAENSEIEVIDTAYTEMRFRLVRGTVIIESASLNPRIHSLTLAAPSGDLQVRTRGLYRLDALPGRKSAVSIYKGRVLWTGAEGRKTQLKSGRRWLLGGSSSSLEPRSSGLDKNHRKDPLNLWSRLRARELVQVNAGLSLASRDSAYPGFGYQNRGGWVLSSKAQWFTYVPFDASPRSPYGFHYTNIRWVRGRDLRDRKTIAGRRRNAYLHGSDNAQSKPPMKITNSVR